MTHYEYVKRNTRFMELKYNQTLHSYQANKEDIHFAQFDSENSLDCMQNSERYRHTRPS